ncbi:MAG: thiamine phosphate synthase [Acidobacteriota bacterium]
MRHLQLGKLYPITDSKNLNGLSHSELASHFLQAGVRFFQVREKSLSDSLLYEQLLRIKTLCEPLGAQFLINDRVDLVLAVGANGVHLGQDDLPVKVARRLLGKDAIIGLSTHNRRQFLQAQSEDIDYVAIGPVFSTSTKQTKDPPFGVDALRGLIPESQHPVVAIGGISLQKAPEVWATGAYSVAVISDILNCPHPAGRLSQYLALAKESNE